MLPDAIASKRVRQLSQLSASMPQALVYYCGALLPWLLVVDVSDWSEAQRTTLALRTIMPFSKTRQSGNFEPKMVTQSGKDIY